MGVASGASGAAQGAGLGTMFAPGIGTAVGGGLGFLGGLLFGNKGDEKKKQQLDAAALEPSLAALRTSAAGNEQKATQLSSMGTDALAPVLSYFQKLVGGDSNALLQATAPERSRVIDQYDTARQAISQFGPRGGGTNAAVAQSRFAQASDLSNITATARREAAGSLGGIGTSLTGLGLSADQLKSMDLNSVVQAILAQQGIDTQRRGQNFGAAEGIGEAVGALLGMWLTRGNQGGAP